MKLLYILLYTLTLSYSQVNYETQIQPIFNTNCTFCHKAGGSATLDLTSYSGVIAGGWSGPSIIAGNHQNSLLYQRITQPIGTNGSMPPNDPLSQSEIELIANWIDSLGDNSLSIVNSLLPSKHILFQNYPNPFNPSTTIRYNLDEDEYVSLDVYNLSGVHITNLVDDVKISGTHFINWNGKNSKGVIVPAGQYFYKIKTDSYSEMRKMILLK